MYPVHIGLFPLLWTNAWTSKWSTWENSDFCLIRGNAWGCSGKTIELLFLFTSSSVHGNYGLSATHSWALILKIYRNLFLSYKLAILGFHIRFALVWKFGFRLANGYLAILLCLQLTNYGRLWLHNFVDADILFTLFYSSFGPKYEHYTLDNIHQLNYKDKLDFPFSCLVGFAMGAHNMQEKASLN